MLVFVLSSKSGGRHTMLRVQQSQWHGVCQGKGPGSFQNGVLEIERRRFGGKPQKLYPL